MPRPDPDPDSGTGFAVLRRRGWTVWFGQHTRQYWAAHTGRVRLACADTPEELLRAVTPVAGAPGTSPFRGFHRDP